MTTPTNLQDSRLSRILSFRIPITTELVIYILIFGAAFALRFWDLGTRAYHHDESIHAQWSWSLLNGSYTHSPVFHGPFYYHAQALTFLVTGVSDYTGRISPALFGMTLTAAPLLLRRQLGTVGTISAVSLLAFSPTIVYFSRFLREDIYVAVFVLLMAVGITRYIDEGRVRWLALLAFSFTGAVLTKEGAFITTGLFLIYLNVAFAFKLADGVMGDRDESIGRLANSLERFFWVTVLAPGAWAIAGLWPFLGFLRTKMGQPAKLPRVGEALLVLGTMALPLLTPVSRHYILEQFNLIEAGRLSWDSTLRTTVSGDDRTALIGLFAITLSFSVFAGFNWRPRLWSLLFVPSALVYLTLMTTFWSNADGLVSGPWGSLDYWIEQQDEARGNQPWFYYYMLMPAYEFLPLTVALGGVWWAVVRGNTFSRLLAFWLVGQWLALSLASEKMPWNNTHIVVPTCLLAAWTIQQAWTKLADRGSVSTFLLPLAGIGALSCGTMIVVAWPPDLLAAPAVRLALIALGAGLIAFAAWPLGRTAVPIVLVTAVVGGLAFFSVRSTVTATFIRADDPRDLLIYTQSSGELAQVSRDINRLAEITGEGQDLRIAVDSKDSFAWPWAWYLRDYRGVAYPDLSSSDASLAEYDVILVNAANLAQANEALGNTPGGLFAEPDRYPHRWWFDETYKAAFDLGSGHCTAKQGNCGPWRLDTWKHFFGNVFDGSWPKTWLLYIRDHEPAHPNGSVDAYALFPASFDRDTGTIEPVSNDPDGPTTDEDGRLTIGSWGTGPGQFLEPIDLAVDASKNLYVIDRASRELQKFDPEGNFVVSADVQGDGSEPSEPWGIGVGPNGEVVVADTFGYRIRVFDSDLTLIRTFGETPDLSQAPGPFHLYGPRDVAFDANGNIWVTDTGNDRIVVYTIEGEFVQTIGGPGSGLGEFDEPVSIAVGADGTAFVADIWNERVQILAPDGTPLREFPVDGWGGGDATDKPYMAVLPNGTLALGLPLAGEVRIYTPDGELLVTLGTDSIEFDRPYGLAPLPDGRLWVAEGGSRRLRLFEIP